MGLVMVDDGAAVPVVPAYQRIDDARERVALLRAEQRPGAGDRAVDQTIRVALVEPRYPIAPDLETDIFDAGYLTPSLFVGMWLVGREPMRARDSAWVR